MNPATHTARAVPPSSRSVTLNTIQATAQARVPSTTATIPLSSRVRSRGSRRTRSIADSVGWAGWSVTHPTVPPHTLRSVSPLVRRVITLGVLIGLVTAAVVATIVSRG